MKIVVDDLSGPEIAEFLEEHVQRCASITPLESKHALDLDGLRKPEITFWSVWDDDTLVGCGAIKRLDAGHAELKSMRSAPRGSAAGSRPCCSSTSSPRPPHGFRPAEPRDRRGRLLPPGAQPVREVRVRLLRPFADYQPDPNSVFLTRVL